MYVEEENDDEKGINGGKTDFTSLGFTYRNELIILSENGSRMRFRVVASSLVRSGRRMREEKVTVKLSP
jgi:hypothetical protein